MRNFNPELAQEVVSMIESGSSWTAGSKLHQLASESECQACCQGQCAENCDCCGISYNDTVAVAERLRSLLQDAGSAPFDVAYGVLFPKFVCIASKAVEALAGKKVQDNGNTGSEPSPEQSPEANSGGQDVSGSTSGDDRRGRVRR